LGPITSFDQNVEDNENRKTMLTYIIFAIIKINIITLRREMTLWMTLKRLKKKKPVASSDQGSQVLPSERGQKNPKRGQKRGYLDKQHFIRKKSINLQIKIFLVAFRKF
jgi:hypothetical protein